MPKNQASVWVVDDDPDDLYLVQLAFQRVLPALSIRLLSDGESLLSGLKQAATLPSLVLLDLNMTPSNGFEILQHLRSLAHGQAIPVVVFTTSDAADDRNRAFAMGANGFQTKPDSIGDIGQLLLKLNVEWQLNASVE
ncbi:response regulator [Fibrella sp. USSR17]